MVDFAKLVLELDTSDLEQGEAKLKNLTVAGDKAEKSAKSVVSQHSGTPWGPAGRPGESSPALRGGVRAPRRRPAVLSLGIV